MIEATIPVSGVEELLLLLGTSDQHLRRIHSSVAAKISTRDGRIHVRGDENAVMQATAIIEQLKKAVVRDGALEPEHVSQIIAAVTDGNPVVPPSIVDVPKPGYKVRPRTPGQSRYVQAIRDHDLVFCAGPAGTGKTYLAVATAVESLFERQIGKIVLVRPAVEAGESLGYLPGDMQAKINPYLRPLLDALREMMDYEQIKRYMADDVIEVVPLAYMRGRTLNNAFIIMDEAQNTTVSQMKMCLTRMGMNSKVVVSGDTSQVDLPPHTKSGLVDAIVRLRNIRGYARVSLGKDDIVRHRLVQEIVKAYDDGARKKK